MNKRKSYENFHLLQFLDEYGIPYRTSGKNIGAEWIGIETCPFCMGGGYHFGVHARSKVGTCWICGEKCSPFGMIMALLSCQKSDAHRVLRQHTSGDLSWIPDPETTGEEVVFPDGMLNILNVPSKKYLIKRGFVPRNILEQFKIRSTPHNCRLDLNGKSWDFGSRIIAPVYIDRMVHCYVGRDYTGAVDPKYMNSPVPASRTSPHRCIYNYDNLGKRSIFVEGITDVWRMGAKTGAFLGITFTKEQIALVARKNIKEAVILFDNGAEKRARQLASALTSVVDKISVAFLKEGDPGELTEDEAIKIKYELIGEI